MGPAIKFDDDDDDIEVNFTSPIVPDGGWGWVVVIAGFIAHVISHGILYSFGIIFIALEESFESSKADVSWIGSIATGMVYLTGPLAGKLTSRFGCRLVTIGGALIVAAGNALGMMSGSLSMLYLSMGVIAGLGYGFVFLSTIVVVSQYFEKRRSIACSIALSGAGTGAFIFNPIIKFLLPLYGWRGSLLIEAGILLNCVVCGLLYRPLKVVKTVRYKVKDECVADRETQPLTTCPVVDKDEQQQIDGYTESYEDTATSALRMMGQTHEENDSLEKCVDNCVRQDDVTVVSRLKDYFGIFKDTYFCIFTLSQFLFFFGFYLPFIYLPDKVLLSGYGSDMMALVVSVIGIGSVVGRLVFGYIADHPRVSRLWMFNISFLISGVCTALVPLYTQLPLLFMYSSVYGTFSGVTLSLTSVVLTDLVGIDKLADTFGINNLFTGVAVLIGPPIAGWMFDLTKSYDLSFLVAGLAMTLGGIAMSLTTLLQKRNRTIL